VEQPRLTPSRIAQRQSIPIVLPPVILDVHEVSGQVRIGLFVANNPINNIDPLGLQSWMGAGYGALSGPLSGGLSGSPTPVPVLGTQTLTQDYLQNQYQLTYERLQNTSPWEQANPLSIMTFDTDFWTGTDKDYNWIYNPPGSGNHCPPKTFRGNEVNYLGIGEYAAWEGLPLGAAEAEGDVWKAFGYGQFSGLNQNEEYWMSNGYNAYETIQSQQPVPKRHGSGL